MDWSKVCIFVSIRQRRYCDWPEIPGWMHADRGAKLYPPSISFWSNLYQIKIMMIFTIRLSCRGTFFHFSQKNPYGDFLSFCLFIVLYWQDLLFVFAWIFANIVEFSAFAVQLKKHLKNCKYFKNMDLPCNSFQTHLIWKRRRESLWYMISK